MHLFIPYFDATSGEQVLHEARRIVRPGDRVTVMASVVVPGGLPVDVDAGAIWKVICQAERRLFHARQEAERIFPRTVTFRFVRVQARDQATAIRTGAIHYRADLILFDAPNGFRGALSLRFGTIAAALRNAPCNVRFVGTMAAKKPAALTTEPIAAAPLSNLEIIAVNPALARAGAEERARETEGQHAS